MSYSSPPPSYQPPASHPQSTLVLVLGIVGLVACQLAAPFAWVMGNRVVAEIDASGGAMGGRDSANIGRICGIIGTVLAVLAVLFVVFAFVVLGAFSASTSVG